MKTFLVAFVTLAASAGVLRAQEKAPDRTRAINITAGPQQWLYIFDDGSGIVGHGAGGTSQASFHSGSFDVAEVSKRLRLLPEVREGAAGDHYAYTLEAERQGPDRPGPVHLTDDAGYIPSLFEKAVQATGKKGDFPETFGRLRTPRR